MLTRRRLSDNRLSAIPDYVRGCPELSSFFRAYTVNAGSEVVKSHSTFFLNVVYGALRFQEGVSKSTFSNCASGREGRDHTK